MPQLSPVAAAEPAELIAQELAQLKPIASVRGLLVFSAQADRIPVTMLEIGRLRELMFRSAGAGRNLARDLDALDYGEHAYHQLLVWDPARQEVVAIYRYQLGWQAAEHGHALLRTSQLFEYSTTFCRQVLPYSIELGRSVVNTSAKARTLGFFALWAGLGALARIHPQLQYFFGNVSLYQSLGNEAIACMVQFCQQLYTPPQPMMRAKTGLSYAAGQTLDSRGWAKLDPNGRIRQLQQLLKPYGCRLPPILQSYLSVGNAIWFDDAALDDDFGQAYELSIVVPLTAVSGIIRQRFLSMTA
ncbi:GNAT family N-acetyltransferase [Alkalimonas amylolytica]|uniref:L-ornithine N(alpha)-acyltransferase n=1 Tax=Alkalimonas amylolytica TaxID=152573 RepID=A0A1H3XRJ9_ALKAM|nr:GNAT family N-acetyltransferase [Alkalimonas amylolytica]SEA02127.1 Acetyltransferase (GNAT) domain-containing protein [Alkalimonas amylolytica]